MTESYVRRIALEQTGWSTAAGDWTEVALGSNIPLLAATDTVGLIFSVQVVEAGVADIGSPFNLDANGGALDPPIWLGGSVLNLIIGGFAPLGFELYLRVDPAAALFSDANPPLLSVGTNTLLQSGFALQGSIPGSVSFGTDDDFTIRSLQAGRGRWNGRIPLILDVGVITFSTVLLNNTPNRMFLSQTTLHPFFSGLAGGPGGKFRVVRDGRFAMPAYNTELVRDGDNRGLWVRPKDFDPEDEPARYRPRSEGTVDDFVPDT